MRRFALGGFRDEDGSSESVRVSFSLRLFFCFPFVFHWLDTTHFRNQVFLYLYFLSVSLAFVFETMRNFVRGDHFWGEGRGGGSRGEIHIAC